MKIFENPWKSISDDAQTYPKGHPSNLGKGQGTSFWALFLGRTLECIMRHYETLRDTAWHYETLRGIKPQRLHGA